MNYPETIEFLYNSLPMYHRIGKAAYKADITNTVALMDHLHNPHKKFKSIHIAGTNGKGSVSHMMASILQESGLKIGLYTSPHLVDFRERIRINGKMITEEQVSAWVTNHLSFLKRHELSFFEMTVGLAFDIFAQEQVDIAVIEVGMGGRLDSTNVIDPLLSVITNIGFDHTQFLGNTLYKIACEKAGIIKPGIPVVIGETHNETAPAFLQKAQEQNSPIFFADQNMSIITQEEHIDNIIFDIIHNSTTIAHNYHCPLGGFYQKKNLVTLFQTLTVLQELGVTIAHNHIENGIANVVANTGFRGRWETIGRDPLTICETAHNSDGVKSMLNKLSAINYRQLHIVYGCVNDKDFEEILYLLPKNALYYYTEPSVPRKLPVEKLYETAHAIGLPGFMFTDVHKAIESARSNAQNNDLILITGSIFLIADVLTDSKTSNRTPIE